MVIRYSLYRVNTVAWLKVSNRSLFFLRRLLSQNGARVSPKYISFRNLFCPFNDGLNRWASDEHTQQNTKMNVTVVRREVYSPQSTGIFKSRAIFYFTLPGHKSEPAMGLRQVWQVATGAIDVSNFWQGCFHFFKLNTGFCPACCFSGVTLRSSEENDNLRMHLVEHLAALASKEIILRIIQSILVIESCSTCQDQNLQFQLSTKETGSC